MDMDMDTADEIVEMELDSTQSSKVTTPAPQLHDEKYAVVDDQSSRQAKTGVDDCVAAALTPVGK